MKWFKHLTRSKSDPDIMESELLFKAQGPYVFWRLLEILADEDAIEKPLIMNLKVFKMWFPSVTFTKMIMILTYFRDKNRILFKIFDDKIKISCCKFTDISSDYAAKVRREFEACSKRVRPQEVEVEVEVEEDKSLIIKPKKEKEKTWRENFKIYQSLVLEAAKSIIADSAEMERQQKYHPNLNIKLTIEKAVNNYWGTVEGWEKKKSKKSKTINMRRTLINNIDRNKVWQDRNHTTNSEINEEPAT